MLNTPLSDVLVALGIVAAVIIGVVVLVRLLMRTVQSRSDASRLRALGEPAARLGLTPLPPGTPLPDDLPPFELLSTGSDRRASNILRGSAGGNSIVVFDYWFFDAKTMRKRFSSLHYSQSLAGATIACVKGSWLSLPDFAMEPSLAPMLKEAEEQIEKQLGDGMMAAGVKHLMQVAEGVAAAVPGWEYPDRPDFTYRVRGGNEPAVRALFTPAVLDYFRDHPGWIVEGRGDWLLLTFPCTQMQMPNSAPQQARVQVIMTVSSSTGTGNKGQLPAERLDALVQAATATLDVFRTAAGVRS